MMSISSFVCTLCFSLLPIVFCISKHEYPEKYSLLKNNKPVSNNNTDYILPTNLKPSWYQLVLSTNLNNSSFSGNVRIFFDVLIATDVIVLHMNNDSLTLLGIPEVVAKERVNVTSISFDPIHEFVEFQLNTLLSVQNNATISIDFLGRLGNDMEGYYLSTYSTSTSNHSMAVTQFEPTSARRAFPCFDEPKYRAKFSISMIRLPTQTSLSNMVLNYSVPDRNYIRDVYKISPPMPTYLVAFVVSDLANITDGKKFRVFAREAVIQEGTYSLSVGQPLLEKIGNFVGIQYPLDKMDVVAVPDFDAGAMENWGLTTYREKYVLFNSVLNTRRDKYGVISVIAHEFGHQWFGDLVTPEWWDYTWLNEAFATYFEYIIPRQVDSFWKDGDAAFVMWNVQYALSKDIGNPRPMTSAVYTPQQIQNIFDYVIYEKGASILRMIENFLTTPIWQAGLKKYLTDNAYKTGTPEELFSALQNQTTELNNINETLQGWTTQPGYPLINVTLSNSTNNSSGLVYKITQSPYAVNASHFWNVPLTFTTQSESTFDASKASKHWLLPSKPETSTITVNETGWIIFNIEQIGFYRVNYDVDNWAKLKIQLDTNFSAIGNINRAQILDDAFHLGQTGHLDFHKVIGLTHYLPNETEIAPWNAFFGNMRFLINQFEGTSTGDALKQYSQGLISAPFKSVVSNMNQAVSSFTGALILQSITSFACDIGLPACESLAQHEFDLWRHNTTNHTILPEVKGAFLCTALRKDVSIYAFKDVWNYYLQSDNAAEKLTLMGALGCITSDAAVSEYLDSVCDINSTAVRLQDRWIAFRALASQQSGITPVLHYIADNFDKVNKALGSDISIVMSAIGQTVSQGGQIALVESLSKDPAVDQKFKDLLNSTVLPAVQKRQDWLLSKPASSLKMWASSFIPSSATHTTFSTLLIIASVAILVNYIF